MNASFRALILLALVTTAGCTTARMPLPDSLADAERLAVEGRRGMRIKEQLRFGPYEATGIDRSWTRGSALRVNQYEGNKRAQRYTFRLHEHGTARWDVQCRAFLRVREGHFDIVDVEFENRSELVCALQALDAPGAEWSLHLRGEEARAMQGDLRNGTVSFRVRGTNAMEKAIVPMESPSGYELWDEERAIAAVEVVNAGAVWVRAPMPAEQHGLLAATAAGLLLYEDLRASLDE